MDLWNSLSTEYNYSKFKNFNSINLILKYIFVAIFGIKIEIYYKFKSK